MDNYSSQNTAENGECALVPTKKPKRGKLFLIIGVIVAIALIAILVFALSGKPRKIIPTVSDLTAVYDKDSEKTLFYADGELLAITVDGELEGSLTSIDGAIMVFATSEEKNDGTEVETLYYTDGKEIREIATDVDDVMIAPNGKACAYLVKDEAEEVNRVYKLFLYDFENGEGTQLSKKIPSTSSYVISADGESVLYNEYVDGASETKMFLYKNGASESLGKNLTPMGVSEDAKYIYFFDDGKNTTYVRNEKGENVKIANEKATLFFNYNGTEVLTQISGGAYIVKNDDETTRVKIAKKISSFSFHGVAGTARSTSDTCYYGVETFAGMTFIDYDDGDYTLYRLDDTYERVELAEDVSSLRISEDGSKLYLIRDDDLYCGDSNGNPEDFERIATDVDSYGISFDGSICYYLDDDDTLYYVDGSKTGAKVAEDVKKYGVTSDGYALFLIDYSSTTGEGTLYSAYKDDGKERVADDVCKIDVTNHGAYYMTQEKAVDGSTTTYTVYGASEKADFEKIFEYEE